MGPEGTGPPGCVWGVPGKFCNSVKSISYGESMLGSLCENFYVNTVNLVKFHLMQNLRVHLYKNHLLHFQMRLLNVSNVVVQGSRISAKIILDQPHLDQLLAKTYLCLMELLCGTMVTASLMTGTPL